MIPGFFFFVRITANNTKTANNGVCSAWGGIMDYEALGKKSRRKRRKMDITQEQLAALVGISTSFMGHIERGTRVPSVETLYRVCKALGASADYLMGI